MILVNKEGIDISNFPDGTKRIAIKNVLPINNNGTINTTVCITWHYQRDEELSALVFIKKHLDSLFCEDIRLELFYIPNGRMDRTKDNKEVFTLKYFAELINWLNFKKVYVFDPHSNVSSALFNNLSVKNVKWCIDNSLEDIRVERTELPFMFYPDEGSMKRYSEMFNLPYAFGIKKRDWKTGKIMGLEVSGGVDLVMNSDILICDDICSYGGTFYHSALKLKELGARNIYLYVSHCENSIFEGKFGSEEVNILETGLIERVYTTDSIIRKEHQKIEVMKL